MALLIVKVLGEVLVGGADGVFGVGGFGAVDVHCGFVRLLRRNLCRAKIAPPRYAVLRVCRQSQDRFCFCMPCSCLVSSFFAPSSR